jgi:hypothetical protein
MTQGRDLGSPAPAPLSASGQRLLRNARREAALILAVWAGLLVWVVGASWGRGYGRPPEDFRSILGMPDWILWGVALPWLVATLLTLVIGARVLKSDALAEPEERAGNEADD